MERLSVRRWLHALEEREVVIEVDEGEHISSRGNERVKGMSGSHGNRQTKRPRSKGYK